MKYLIAATLILGLSSVGIVGCAEKETAKQTTTTKSPGGSTTTTIEKEVKKTGTDKDKP